MRKTVKDFTRAARGSVKPKVVKKKAFICRGGPMDGMLLYLTSALTLTFTLKQSTGRYVQEMACGHKNVLIWDGTLPPPLSRETPW